MIIKNCPSCKDFDVFGMPNSGCCYYYNDYCKNHDNCILKQIVRMCQKRIHTYISDYEGGMYYVANEILELLEVEECQK